VQGHGRAAATAALDVLTPEGWLAEARQFLGDSEIEPDPAELTARAVALLADLDEANLAVWAARALGVSPGPDLEESLGACAVWLEEHADVFLHAGFYVQAVGLGLRPDLPAVDLDLAWTADKYVILLDHLEEAEAELSLAGKPLEPALLEAARRRFLRPVAAWLPPLRPVVLAAAARPGDRPQPRLLRWRSPDRRWQASLVLPTYSDAAAEGGTVRLNLFEGEGPAQSLSGQTLWLAGVPGVVDPEGAATFLLGRLREAAAAGEGPTLRVGTDERGWEPVAVD
jgi:hypothetical protein